MIVSVMFYLITMCVVWPWKTPLMNTVDAVTTGCMIMMTAAAIPFVGHPDEQVMLSATTWVVFFFGSAVIMMGVYFSYTICFEIYRMYSEKLRNRILADEKEVCTATASDLVQICSRVSTAYADEEDQVNLAQFMKILGPYDVQMLQKIIYMLNFELFQGADNGDGLAVLRTKSGSNYATKISVARIKSF
jgi:hypothetical protein